MMFTFVLAVLALTAGDTVLISYEGRYITFTNMPRSSLGVQDLSPFWKVLDHNNGGLSFVSEKYDKAMNYEPTYNTIVLYTKGVEKTNNNWKVHHVNDKYMFENSHSTCLTIINSNLDFKPCDESNKAQMMTVEVKNTPNNEPVEATDPIEATADDMTPVAPVQPLPTEQPVAQTVSAPVPPIEPSVTDKSQYGNPSGMNYNKTSQLIGSTEIDTPVDGSEPDIPSD